VIREIWNQGAVVIHEVIPSRGMGCWQLRYMSDMHKENIIKVVKDSLHERTSSATCIPYKMIKGIGKGIN
jgi:hypothetical protein